MPDTALESVVWMDVTAKDVVLLITMIELRDIMVDERYWKRGYWAIDRPRVRPTSASRNTTIDDEDEEDDEGDWDGFYYLINQEGADRKVSQPKKKFSLALSAGAGQAPRRKASTIRDFSANGTRAAASSESSTTSPRSPTTMTATSSSSPSTLPSTFSKQSIAPLPTQQSVSGLGQLVKSASSTTTETSTTTPGNPSSSASAILDHTKKIRRNIPAPEPWQGFGEGVSESNPRTVFVTEELPPAVQLFEALKAEINDVTMAARSSGKGKKSSRMSSDPWRY
ncbi:hypothetical protein BGZ89_003780 [Linnemannia elongata]|nr:hypothetical protein BGZ89_003780 [Linnemannia elongata]